MEKWKEERLNNMKYINKKIISLLSLGLIILGVYVRSSEVEASYYPLLGNTVGSVETEYGVLSTYYSKYGSLLININGERADSFVALMVESNAQEASVNGVTCVKNGQIVNWEMLINSGRYTPAQISYIALLSSLYSEKNKYINTKFPDAYGKNYEGYVGYLISDITEFFRLSCYGDMWAIKDKIFDPIYYATAYPDSVKRLGVYGGNTDALYIDYLLRGQEEGKNANASFNINAYIAANPDLDSCPFYLNERTISYRVRGDNEYYEHWIDIGCAEGRIATVPEAVAAGYTGRLPSHDVSEQLANYMSKYY